MSVMSCGFDNSEVINMVDSMSVEMQHDVAAQDDSVSYEVFRDWAVLHQDALSITRWLLKEKSTLSLSSDFDAPTFYQTLAGVTHCTLSVFSLLSYYYAAIPRGAALSLHPSVRPPDRASDFLGTGKPYNLLI